MSEEQETEYEYYFYIRGNEAGYEELVTSNSVSTVIEELQDYHTSITKLPFPVGSEKLKHIISVEGKTANFVFDKDAFMVAGRIERRKAITLLDIYLAFNNKH